mgnify:CR=1 FL=1
MAHSKILLLHGDANTLPLMDNSIHSIICDPPYGLEFQGKAWESFERTRS